MLAPKDSADLHWMAYAHAKDMIVSMNTPFRVKIALTQMCIRDRYSIDDKAEE